MKQVFTSVLIALALAGTAQAMQVPAPQTTPVVCVTDGCTSENPVFGPRR